MGGQPLYILSEDTTRTRGQDAQSSNIAAGRAVSEAVRTTLGPRGMDKMLVDDGGTVVITNDGATILDEMDIEHPAAQMIVEVAESQEEEVGDGTTTAAVLAGQLLAKAEDLLEQDVHPTTIVEGYHAAGRFAEEAIEGQVIEADLDDEFLASVAESSMTGKGTGDLTADQLAEIVVGAIRHVETDDGVERDDVRVLTKTGASSSATRLIEGVVVDEEPAHDQMPRSIEDATIAVLDVELDVKEANIDAEYSVSDVDQLTAAIDAEESELRGYADALADAGVDVAFVTDDIDDRVASFLADRDVLAYEDVDDDDARAIARATGAHRVGTVEDIDEGDFGHADSIAIERTGEDELTIIEGGAAARSVTVLIRGGTEHVVDELERSIADALDVVTVTLESGGAVPGAGQVEIAIADHVRAEAASVTGRKQLAIEAFADALDMIPRTLAHNAGMDPIDALVDLRASFENEGHAGLIALGDDAHVDDPAEYGIYDPAAVKREAIESATEAATMIVRIDDIIAAD